VYSTKHYLENEILSNKNPKKTLIPWNGLIRHTKGLGKCVGLYRMSEYSGFASVNRNTLGSYIFVGCHRMLEIRKVKTHNYINRQNQSTTGKL